MSNNTRHNKGFKYEYELTPMRRFNDWLDKAVGYAIVIAITVAITGTIVNLAQSSSKQ